MLVGITVFTQKGHLIEKGCLITCTKTHLEGVHLLEGALTGTRVLNLNVKVSNIILTNNGSLSKLTQHLQKGRRRRMQWQQLTSLCYTR